MRFHSFLIGLIALCLLPVAAARADSDPFTVAGIKVDATAASSTEAQNVAINGGRHQAWTTLVHRLTRTQDWSHVPALDDIAIQKLIRTYVVDNERRSTTRYVANVTYIFNADAVRRLLRSANVAYADMQARPILVIPMGQSYAPRSPWAAAWADPRYATGAVPLVPPSGDAMGGVTLNALQFATATWNDVEPTASRAHANQAVLAQALPASGHITVKLRLIAPGGSQQLADVDVPVPANTPPAKAFASAAAIAADAIANAWKSRAAVDFNQRSKMTLEVRIPSLVEWGTVQQRLAAIPTVLDVTIVAMNIGEARIVLTYAGTADQLRDSLAQGGLELSAQGGNSWLALGTQSDSASTQ